MDRDVTNRVVIRVGLVNRTLVVGHWIVKGRDVSRKCIFVRELAARERNSGRRHYVTSARLVNIGRIPICYRWIELCTRFNSTTLQLHRKKKNLNAWIYFNLCKSIIIYYHKSRQIHVESEFAINLKRWTWWFKWNVTFFTNQDEGQIKSKTDDVRCIVRTFVFRLQQSI